MDRGRLLFTTTGNESSEQVELFAKKVVPKVKEEVKKETLDPRTDDD